MKTSLILASTSPYRQQLLQKINLPFSCVSPEIDETPLAQESAEQLVKRLAIAKATAATNVPTNALIIGSDQVAVINGQIIGKPHNFETAFTQLSAASNKIVTFYTGLCLWNNAKKNHQVVVETFKVHFRELSDTMITNYLNIEQPFNCAGSFKSEGLGIALFSRLEGKDPNTLVGLPIITLIDMLANEGLNVLEHQEL